MEPVAAAVLEKGSTFELYLGVRSPRSRARQFATDDRLIVRPFSQTCAAAVGNIHIPHETHLALIDPPPFARHSLGSRPSGRV